MYPSVKTLNVSAGYTVITKDRPVAHPKNKDVILKRKYVIFIKGI